MTSGRPLCFLFLLASLLLPQLCAAGIGMGSSAPTLVDTVNPVLNLDPLPENFWIHAGNQLNFHWTSADHNPGTSADDFTAFVRIDQQPTDPISWYPQTDEYTWNWIVPEVQTANCRVEVTARDFLGNTTVAVSDYFTVLYSTTGAADIPRVVSFQPPYPNPFNPSCEMVFSLPGTQNAVLEVFDARGRKVRDLIRGSAPAGTTHVKWDGTNQQGRPQSAGVYFFVLSTEGPDGPIKMVQKATLIP